MQGNNDKRRQATTNGNVRQALAPGGRQAMTTGFGLNVTSDNKHWLRPQQARRHVRTTRVIFKMSNYDAASGSATFRARNKREPARTTWQTGDQKVRNQIGKHWVCVGRNVTTGIRTTPSTRRLQFKLDARVRRFVGTTYIWCTLCGVHVRFNRTLHTTTWHSLLQHISGMFMFAYHVLSCEEALLL